MGNSKKSSGPKKLNARVGKRALRAMSPDQLATVSGGDPGCVASPPPPPCFTVNQEP